jgi:beta-phosphoglucomutase
MRPALLFDLDGTLMRSDPLHAAVFADLLGQHGIALGEADYARLIHGRSNADIFADLFPDADAVAMSEAKEAAFRDRLGDTAPPTPGLLELLDRAEASGLACAVVTNAPPLNATAMLRAIGLAGRFPVVVAEGDAVRGKPDPAPYLLAMQRLDADPAHSLAFEDSTSGVTAAVAAGLRTVGLRSSLSDAALRAAGASLTIEDFTDPALAPWLSRLEGTPA